MLNIIKGGVVFIKDWAKSSWLKAAIVAFLLGGIPGLVYFVSPEIGAELKQVIEAVSAEPAN